MSTEYPETDRPEWVMPERPMTREAVEWQPTPVAYRRGCQVHETSTESVDIAGLAIGRSIVTGASTVLA